jgi:hypothetical protein
MEVSGLLHPAATPSPEKGCPVSTDLVIQWAPKAGLDVKWKSNNKKNYALSGNRAQIVSARIISHFIVSYRSSSCNSLLQLLTLPQTEN